MKNTAPGYDTVLCWIFKPYSYELAGIMAFVIKKTLRTDIAHSGWLSAVLTPVPEVTSPQNIQCI